MSKGNNQNGQQNSGQKQSKTRVERIQENKPLFGAVVLVALIILAAIGVGSYYLISNITSNNADNTEESGNETEENGSEEGDSENNGSEESTEEGDSENSNENGEESTDNGDSNGSESENTGDNTGSENNNGSDNTGSENNGSDNSSNEASGHSAAGLTKSLAVQDEIARTGVWRATDYIFGDIIDSVYTVQLGDTLWEIADGYYGDSYRWVDILNVNDSKVDYLPNGQEALIYPGTILDLPQ